MPFADSSGVMIIVGLLGMLTTFCAAGDTISRQNFRSQGRACLANCRFFLVARRPKPTKFLTSPRHRSRGPRARCLPLLASFNVSHVRQVWVNRYNLITGHLTVKVRSNLTFRKTFSDGVLQR
ncbi:hypothetical protein BJV78DRAFT_1198608 [Lactifluus subvellereus]|nr:hypothetical protein BJV78DRAFT_1198608 [Lactifluus subvellereus]